MSKKIKFSVEDEEKKIDFIKSFLHQTSVLKRSSLSSLQQSQSQSPIPEEDTQQSIDETQSYVGSYAESDGSFSLGSVSQTSSMVDTNEILRAFLEQRPKLSDFMPQKPADDIQLFFDSMASTVRKFSPLSIARIKLKINQIVGEEEIAWAQNSQHGKIQIPPSQVLVAPQKQTDQQEKKY